MWWGGGGKPELTLAKVGKRLPEFEEILSDTARRRSRCRALAEVENGPIWPPKASLEQPRDNLASRRGRRGQLPDAWGRNFLATFADLHSLSLSAMTGASPRPWASQCSGKVRAPLARSHSSPAPLRRVSRTMRRPSADWPPQLDHPPGRAASEELQNRSERASIFSRNHRSLAMGRQCLCRTSVNDPTFAQQQATPRVSGGGGDTLLEHRSITTLRRAGL